MMNCLNKHKHNHTEKTEKKHNRNRKAKTSLWRTKEVRFLCCSYLPGRWTRSRLWASALPAHCQRPSRPGESPHLWAWTTSLFPLLWPGAEPEPAPTALYSGKDSITFQHFNPVNLLASLHVVLSILAASKILTSDLFQV